MMWEMMLREFGRHKLRTALTALGVMIGIFLVTSVSSISEGVTYYVNDQIAITSGLVTVMEADIPGRRTMESEIDEKYIEELEGLGGVSELAPLLFVTIDGKAVTGTDPGRENVLRGVNIEISDGRDNDDGAYELVLGSAYAENNDYGIGDKMELKNAELEVVGVLEESGDMDIDNGIHTSLTTLQEITDMEETLTLIMVKPMTPEDADDIEQTINDEFDDLQAATDRSIMNSVAEMTSQLNMMTFALGSIAALISGVVIMNVMIISVRERRREIGTMKAIGATNRRVLLAVILESVTISVAGAVVGVMLSFGGAAAVNSLLPEPIAIITPRLVVQGILFAVFIGAVSGFLPARQAAKLNPIEAIRYE